jgi:hypothetical protein
VIGLAVTGVIALVLAALAGLREAGARDRPDPALRRPEELRSSSRSRSEAHAAEELPVGAWRPAEEFVGTRPLVLLREDLSTVQEPGHPRTWSSWRPMDASASDRACTSSSLL